MLTSVVLICVGPWMKIPLRIDQWIILCNFLFRSYQFFTIFQGINFKAEVTDGILAAFLCSLVGIKNCQVMTWVFLYWSIACTYDRSTNCPIIVLLSLQCIQPLSSLSNAEWYVLDASNNVLSCCTSLVLVDILILKFNFRIVCCITEGFQKAKVGLATMGIVRCLYFHAFSLAANSFFLCRFDKNWTLHFFRRRNSAHEFVARIVGIKVLPRVLTA